MTNVAESVGKDQEDRFFWEKKLSSEGHCFLAGVDEAGRGPLAGPVVAAAVMFPDSWYLEGLPGDLSDIYDSKKISSRKRAQLFKSILDHASIRYGIAQVEAPEIDQINILKATHRAMALAIDSIRGNRADYALVDGLPVKGLGVPHTAVVKGDAKSYSIAAASILAKEHRDLLMIEWDRQFPQYGFAKHKGYGTAQHREAILKHGPCPLHRKSFLGNLLEQQSIFQWDD